MGKVKRSLLSPAKASSSSRESGDQDSNGRVEEDLLQCRLEHEILVKYNTYHAIGFSSHMSFMMLIIMVTMGLVHQEEISSYLGFVLGKNRIYAH